MVWDWSEYNVNNFRYPGISCHTIDGELWNLGGSSLIGYFGYEGADVDGAAWIFYPSAEDYGALSWLTDDEDNALGSFIHSDFAIDEVTEISYAVYEHDVDPNLLVRTDDFGSFDEDGFHPYLTMYEIGNDIDNISNPSIEANDDTVVIVAEIDGDVVCFYSSDALTTVDQVTVETDAAYPEVMLSPDGKFICSYVKDAAIYIKTSEDGSSWEDEGQVADSEINDGYGTHDLGKGVMGVYSAWEDIRSEDIDIYFALGVEIEVPILEITSITGGLGISAVIKNVGTAVATDVEWNIIVIGGILGLIDVDVSDTEASLAINDEFEISTGIFFGLGAIDITVKGSASEGFPDQVNTDGTQIIIFSSVN